MPMQCSQQHYHFLQVSISSDLITIESIKHFFVYYSVQACTIYTVCFCRVCLCLEMLVSWAERPLFGRRNGLRGLPHLRLAASTASYVCSVAYTVDYIVPSALNNVYNDFIL